MTGFERIKNSGLQGDFDFVPRLENEADESGRDIRALAVDMHADAPADRQIARPGQGTAYSGPDGDLDAGGDFPGHDDPALGRHHLHRTTSRRILKQKVIQDCVSNQVTQLVRVTDTGGLAGTDTRHQGLLQSTGVNTEEPAHHSERARIQDVHGVRHGAGWLVKKAFHQLIRRRRPRVVAGRGSPDDLVNLVPVHIRLLTKRLRYGDERGRDGGTGGGVFAE